MTFPDSNAYPLIPDAKTLKEYGKVAIQKGLTKRELFAAMAMQGYCVTDQKVNAVRAAQFAVEIADALIAELNKEVQS